MTPTYQVRIWQEDGWWLARVLAASENADASPLNALTQSRGLAKIESMARDLIATVLDADEDTFDVEFDYLLPGETGELVCQARGARAWLDAAQDLWQELSTAAARALAAEGYSLRETATLLGLSHQRVDQILGNHSNRKRSNLIVLSEGSSETRWLRSALSAGACDVDDSPLIVYVAAHHGSWLISHDDQPDGPCISRFRSLLREAALAHANEQSDSAAL